MKRGKLTANAKAFMKANRSKGVIEGNAKRCGGATYTLRGGRTFTLDAAECRAVGVVYWHGDAYPGPVQ